MPVATETKAGSRGLVRVYIRRSNAPTLVFTFHADRWMRRKVTVPASSADATAVTVLLEAEWIGYDTSRTWPPLNPTLLALFSDVEGVRWSKLLTESDPNGGDTVPTLDSPDTYTIASGWRDLRPFEITDDIDWIDDSTNSFPLLGFENPTSVDATVDIFYARQYNPEQGLPEE
jgi:hypothetical protein